MELRLQVAQAGVGETAERYVAGAARKHPNPCLAVCAKPQGTVIVAVSVSVVACMHERRGRAAVVAIGVGKRLDWFSDAHRRELRAETLNIAIRQGNASKTLGFTI
ncbi:hypothetical protein BSFA1_79140 (plasmid) [Burkholderia sp. SFA1]|nr:hypothetical protein BSFA1_79140 [Burkholderia sp. SFA1]